jgi:hypothetical protein
MDFRLVSNRIQDVRPRYAVGQDLLAKLEGHAYLFGASSLNLDYQAQGDCRMVRPSGPHTRAHFIPIILKDLHRLQGLGLRGRNWFPVFGCPFQNDLAGFEDRRVDICFNEDALQRLRDKTCPRAGAANHSEYDLAGRLPAQDVAGVDSADVLSNDR